MRVRAADGTDAAPLAALAALTFPLACPPHVTAESIAAFLAANLSEARFADYLADAARDVLLAEVDGQLVGYAMLVAGEPADADVAAAVRIRPTVELSKCYVHPDHHGAGAASALMGAVLDAARERGVAGVWLGVNQLNERAQRFYGKHGFARVGTKRFLVGDRYEDDFVFERPL
ncbi:GNAT family N-acetyltransferase [Protaetiibacter larvae]|uniref:GNAT family N-acetyltransferase n=1 Tax=Protaetiibacter larvae TaxID=2592654 RepID=A0A5C1Y412_9MICO|nr:GNAT family N-acetyltransferase [Protaetiibacter larvae]QEO08753.1 GNAT family N-acetyltransferase [Protaetiibacter larvae]